MLDYPRQVTDPIRGDVPLTEEEHNLLNTRPMLRLHSLAMSPFLHYVFPMANASKFSHAIGSLAAMARLVSEGNEGQGLRLGDRTYRILRLAVLLEQAGDLPHHRTLKEITTPGRFRAIHKAFLSDVINKRLAIGAQEGGHDEDGDAIRDVLDKEDDRQQVLEAILSPSPAFAPFLRSPISPRRLDRLARDSFLVSGVRDAVPEALYGHITLAKTRTRRGPQFLAFTGRHEARRTRHRLISGYRDAQQMIWGHHCIVASELMLQHSLRVLLDWRCVANFRDMRDMQLQIAATNLNRNVVGPRSADDASPVAQHARQLLRRLLRRDLIKRVLHVEAGTSNVATMMELASDEAKKRHLREALLDVKENVGEMRNHRLFVAWPENDRFGDVKRIRTAERDEKVNKLGKEEADALAATIASSLELMVFTDARDMDVRQKCFDALQSRAFVGGASEPLRPGSAVAITKRSAAIRRQLEEVKAEPPSVQAVFDTLLRKGQVTQDGLAQELSLSKSTISKAVNRIRESLVATGCAMTVTPAPPRGGGKGRPREKYSLDPEMVETLRRYWYGS